MNYSRVRINPLQQRAVQACGFTVCVCVCVCQAEAGQRLLDQVRLLERQREEDQVDRAAVINTLAQRLEESQQQCAKLLHTGM